MRSMGPELWGPRPLPHTLVDQLARHGFDHGDAAECARQLANSESSAESALLFVDLGACKFLEGDVDGAVAAWRHAMTGEEDAAAAQAMFNLGLLYEHLYLHDQAIAVLSSAANRGGAQFEPAAIMAAARCHHASGANDAAMESMALLAQTAMAHGSDTEELAQILFGLGEIAHESGRSDRAERAWRAASSGPASPCQRAATGELLTLLIHQGEDEDIVELLERLPPAVVAPHATQVLERVETLHRRDHRLQARTLAAAIDGSAFGPADRFRLADVRRQIGLINEAIDELEVLLNDQRPEVQQQAAFSLGEMYRDHEMADAARSMYERALAIEDDFWAPNSALALGDLAAHDGDRERALEYWTIASTSPTSQVGDAASERLDSAFGQPADQPSTEADTDHKLGASPEPRPSAEPAQVVSLDSLEDDLLLERRVSAAKPVAVVAEPAKVVSLDSLEGDLLLEPRESAAEPVVVVAEPAKVVSLVSLEDDLLLEPRESAAEPVVVVAEPAQVVSLDSLEDDLLLEPMANDRPVPTVAPVGTSGALVGTSDAPATSTVASVSTSNAGLTPTPVPAASVLPQATSSVFRVLSDPNPYAALAPEGHASDIAPSTRNPYAELAPNFDEPSPDPNVQPGDWESMLDGWPQPDTSSEQPSEPPKKRSSAFSRYT